MRLTEGQTFFATIAFFVALPVIGGLFVSLFRSMKSADTCRTCERRRRIGRQVQPWTFD